MTIFKKLYYNTTKPDSYGGIQALQRASHRKRKDVKSWLRSQDVYTLHRTARRNFKRRKTIVFGEDSQYQLDLIDVSKIAHENDRFKFILTAIDVFSKYGFAIPMLNKTAKSTTEAFSKILLERPIKSVSFDRGSEFYNKNFQSLLAKHNVRHFSTYNYIQKASIVERWNQTLLRKLYKLFTETGSKRYVEVLPEIVDSYNHSIHTSTGYTPVNVNSSNREEVWINLYEKYPHANKPRKYAVGDKVRVSRLMGRFEKSYLPNFSEEIYIIDKAIESDPSYYFLKDYSGEEIKGCFYEEEMQLVNKTDDVYLIEKIISTRKRKRKMEYLVKWVGYDDSFNSWIKENDFRRYIN